MKGQSKNENCKQHNTDNETERDKKVPRKREIPKINTVTVIYNGDRKTFDTFMESMIYDYLNSDSLPKCDSIDVVDKVEIIEESA
jgi:hypothetical protein